MNDLTAEIESLNQWKGQEERVEEILSPLKVEGYHAVLDTGELPANEGKPAPPGIHWMLPAAILRIRNLVMTDTVDAAVLFRRSISPEGCGPGVKSNSSVRLW